MLKLAQGRHKAEAVGEPLFSPFAFNGLPQGSAKMLFRKGQLAMVAAPPGVGKSMVVQYALQKGNGMGGPGREKWRANHGIYLSADSDAFTMYCRGASFATGFDQFRIEADVRNPESARAVDATVAAAANHMWFDFRSELTPAYLVELIAAYATRNGKYPEFIVVDNLKNFIIDEGMTDEFAAAEQSLVFLNEIAHITGAALITLHHVTGEHESAASAIPLSGIRGKLSKTPSAIYTLFRPNQNEIIFSVVKDRAGNADPKGMFMGSIKVDYSRGIMQ